MNPVAPSTGRAGGGAPRQRNDLRQYDELEPEWWTPHGPLAMLHWIATARATLVPPAASPAAVLVDLGCGGGLFAPHARALGYHHLGVDLAASSARVAAAHGVAVARADATCVPLADGCADVVAAGEILEHVRDLDGVVDEACRILRPGGTLVLDTIASTPLARLLAITVAERIPGGAPPGIHDPALFVDRARLVARCAINGVELRLSGLRPAFGSLVAWRVGRASAARMVPTWSTAVLFQGVGTKR